MTYRRIVDIARVRHSPYDDQRASASVTDLFAATALHRTRRFGDFRIHVTRGDVESAVPADVVVLVRGDVRDGDDVACRVSSACLTSTALDSAECDCDLQTEAAMAHIAELDRGVLIYLTHQEGRGHGLATKVAALAHKNNGMDTFAAVEALGESDDVRSYEAVGPILDALGVSSVVLLTGSPTKNAELSAHVKISGVTALRVHPHRLSQPSMRAKHERGHEMVGEYADAPSLPYP